MRLIHYSKKPLTQIRSVPFQDAYAGKFMFLRKPHGLWVSVEGEDDWPSWCRSENFGNIDNDYATEIMLATDSKVLHIATEEMLLAFHDRYKTAPPPPIPIWSKPLIDWAKVADNHQGIIIAPYRWESRLMSVVSDWYNTWDCASGCIWDRRAISEWRILKIGKELPDDNENDPVRPRKTSRASRGLRESIERGEG